MKKRCLIVSQKPLNQSVCIAPSIIVQPLSRSVSAGVTVVLVVAAIGTAIQYQWKKDGVDIPNTNHPTLTLFNVASQDAGVYSVGLSNGCASVLSSGATLTVSVAINYLIGWSATDPYVNDSTPLNITNSQSIAFTPGSNIIYSGSLAAFANQYAMLRIPASEPTPTSWSNGDPATSLNKGDIPDFTWRAVFTIGSFKYVCCRNPIVLNTGLDLRFLH